MKSKRQELLAVAGCGLGSLVMCFGLSQAWFPLGFIVGGLELASGSFLYGYSLVKGGR